MRITQRKIIGADLFAGAGGLSLGASMAGIDVLLAVERDQYAAATYKHNHPHTNVIIDDIKKIDIEKKATTLLFGGPPCQPFSLAGKQNGLDDVRGPLLFEIIRFAEHFKPKTILLEQVKGLLSAKNPQGEKGGVFKQFISELERIGYIPKWQVCCAADYGVPQLRERVFVVATYGRNNFTFPDRTHALETSNIDFFGSLPYMTVGEAIDGLGNPDRKIKGTTFQQRVDSHVDVTPDRDRERISYVPEGSYLSAQTHVSEDIRCNLKPKDTTKYLRLSRQRPSNTLRCGEIFYHPTEDRYLTPREYMRIHGYGDDYMLCGPIRSRTGTVKNLDQHRQVANSVPPPLAQAMGTQIRRYLDEQNL
jgi:DNA (cytosine-5)-methyltransferase 1